MPENSTRRTGRIVSVTSGGIRPAQLPQNIVIRENIPAGGNTGDLMAKKSDADGDVEWIHPATSVEEGNQRPVTSAAVYTEIGNINALLVEI